MFAIDRRTARAFRAAVKRCLDGPPAQVDKLPVQARLTADGLTVHCTAPETTVVYHRPDLTGKGVMTFPLSRFAECEGGTRDPVEFALLRPDLAAARWAERGRAREVEVPLSDPGSVPTLPEMPKRFADVPLEFLRAFDDASRLASDVSSKYALARVQVRGGKGAVVGTDTRCLVRSGGFRLPFKQDVLVPRCRAFALPDLASAGDVGIGLTERHLWLRCGPWSVALLIDKDGRFPDADSIVPAPSAAKGRLRLDADDAQRFLDGLARRMRSGPGERSVTLDLSETSCLRYESEGRVTEVPLTNSEFRGTPARMCLSLSMFLTALELRFLEFEVRDADQPLAARDGDRVFVAMPLASSAALPPSADSCRVPESVSVPTRAMAAAARRTAGRTPPAEVSPAMTPAPTSTFDILGEADGLRDGLMQVATHAGRILRFLREACTRQQLVETVRHSLLALANNNPDRGGQP